MKRAGHFVEEMGGDAVLHSVPELFCYLREESVAPQPVESRHVRKGVSVVGKLRHLHLRIDIQHTRLRDSIESIVERSATLILEALHARSFQNCFQVVAERIESWSID